MVIRLAVRAVEPLRQVLLCADFRSPRIHHVFRLFRKHVARKSEIAAVFFREAGRFLELAQILKTYRRARDAIGPVIITGNRIWDTPLIGQT